MSMESHQNSFTELEKGESQAPAAQWAKLQQQSPEDWVNTVRVNLREQLEIQ
jgi:hypothetical protein